LDACADRLHDISGQLLLCYSRNGQLPKRLEDLAEMGTGIVPPLACPVSGKPYVYDRQGLAIPKSDKKILVHDPLPCHTGKRWAVVADAVEADKPLVCRVVLMPDGPIFTPGK
jgi:hypothetical protein